MTYRSPLVRFQLLTVLLLAATACASGDGQRTSAETTSVQAASSDTTIVAEAPVADKNPGTTVAAEAPAEGTGSETKAAETVAAETGVLAQLPVREGPRRETTHSVPHIQTDAVFMADVDAELERRAFALPGLVNQESRVSLPGARSLWIADDIDLARPDVVFSGREIGHIHGDGSLHILLPVDSAIEVAETKWGELHPWVGRPDFWDGMVMLYNPETAEELEITMQLIVDSYNFVTGANLDASEFA